MSRKVKIMNEAQINQTEPGEPDGDAKRHTFTRNELVQALRRPPVPGTLAMLESEGGCPEDLADAIIEALNGAAS